ncbi:hypothetical protein [Albidovulum sp.]
MPVLLLVLLLGVLLYLWWSRRGTTLTRLCRWRPDRGGGADHYRCAACGAECDGPPRHCLRPERGPGAGVTAPGTAPGSASGMAGAEPEKHKTQEPQVKEEREER